MESNQTPNVACRIFKEQINLINQLPKQDRANVLYLSIMNAFNQFENQNDNQIENQNEYAYISISTSLSKSIIELLSKNIVFKEYNNNYGGKRESSGRKKHTKEVKVIEKIDDNREALFNEFWSLYIPVKCKDGRYTDKGSKQVAFKSFCKALEKDSFENIRNGLTRYLKMKAESSSMTANVSTFLNQERWKDEESNQFILTGESAKKISNIQETVDMITKLKNEWS